MGLVLSPLTVQNGRDGSDIATETCQLTALLLKIVRCNTRKVHPPNLLRSKRVDGADSGVNLAYADFTEKQIWRTRILLRSKSGVREFISPKQTKPRQNYSTAREISPAEFTGVNLAYADFTPPPNTEAVSYTHLTLPTRRTV